MRWVLPDKAERACDVILDVNRRVFVFLYANAGFCCCWREQTPASRGRGVRDASQQRRLTEKQPFVSHFGLAEKLQWPRLSFLRLHSSVLFLLRARKMNALSSHTPKTQNPGVNRSLRGGAGGGGYWDLDDLGGLSDWLKAYGLRLKPFQPISDVPSVILGLCLVCGELLKKKGKIEESDFCIDR